MSRVLGLGISCTSYFLWLVLRCSIFQGQFCKADSSLPAQNELVPCFLVFYVHFIRGEIEKPRLRFFSFNPSQKLYLWSPATVSPLLSSAIFLTLGEAPLQEKMVSPLLLPIWCIRSMQLHCVFYRRFSSGQVLLLAYLWFACPI